jgi:hypothetical protein
LKSAIIFKAVFGLVVAACVGPAAALPVLFSFHQHYRVEYPPDSDSDLAASSNSNAPFLVEKEDEKVRWNNDSNNSSTIYAARNVSVSEALHGLDDTTTQSERDSVVTQDSFLSVLSDRPFSDPDS